MSSLAAKQCGDCTLCCKIMEIEQLAKPAGAWCRHCKPGRGCLIYADRPSECRAFSCFWLLNDRLDDSWKPNQAKFVLTTSDDGIEVRCDPGFPEAWRKQPYQVEIRQWALAGETHDVTILVITGRRVIVVTAEREFDLGHVGPEDRIVRELEGGRVVDVTVRRAG